jgi:hypothetical protein
MACFHPLKAYRLPSGDIVFHDHGHGHPMELPCGQCIGCRLDRSREWATRMVHEASMHDDNCFITLTYSPENLPPDGGLRIKDYQKFMKRLRAKYDHKIRFYHCGEYGDKNNRPHYHAILFGHNFNDWVYLFDSPVGYPIYTSPTLESIWGLGFVTIGTVDFESAGYVARYCVKKINGKLKDQIDPKTGLKPYERFNNFTGEITEVLPEYSTMSRRPGIGHNWISAYTNDCYPKDFTTVRGFRVKPPKYYDRYLEVIDPAMFDDIKAQRELSMSENWQENTELRLSQRETVKEAQYKQLVRSL